jgi:8-oxo-dGTP pyrophosphatase MutT (NUDIX family)
VEPGEGVVACAEREVHEEAGVDAAALRLCGTLLIGLGTPPGVAVFIFVGNARGRVPESESLAWFDPNTLASVDVVEDLPVLLPRALEAYRTGRPFSAHSTYGPDGGLQVRVE